MSAVSTAGVVVVVVMASGLFSSSLVVVLPSSDATGPATDSEDGNETGPELPSTEDARLWVFFRLVWCFGRLW